VPWSRPRSYAEASRVSEGEERLEGADAAATRMIRLTSLLIFVGFLTVYAWKDWFKSLCGLILLIGIIQHPGMAEREAKSRARNVLAEAVHNSRLTLETVESVCRGLSGVSGRKALFLVSDGFIAGLSAGSSFDRSSIRVRAFAKSSRERDDACLRDDRTERIIGDGVD
jgi:hypothetical protein